MIRTSQPSKSRPSASDPSNSAATAAGARIVDDDALDYLSAAPPTARRPLYDSPPPPEREIWTCPSCGWRQPADRPRICGRYGEPCPGVQS